MTNVGIIGASGFVGHHLSKELLQRGHTVRAIVRSAGTAPTGTEEAALGDFTSVGDWETSVDGLDTVVLLAARVHVMQETESDPLTAFRKINVDVTRAIAQAAADMEVRKLIFLSSIKVNGEGTLPGSPYHASDPSNPEDPYGVSKAEAEDVLRSISQESELDCVVIRPPLVYGAGVGGNFLRLLKLANSGFPIPLKSVQNARAMISVHNLVDAIIHYSDVTPNEMTTVLVNDRESLSTADLLTMLASASGRPSRLFPFPPAILKMLLKVAGKQAEADRLLGSLDVEISSNPAGIEWKPPVSTRESIQRTVDWYKSGTKES